MTELELHDIMTYIFADHDAPVPPEKRKVWLDQFGHVPFELGMTAARILVGRKTFGLPKASDFKEALIEATTPVGQRITWGEAWDMWVDSARPHGWYDFEKATRTYEQMCPMGYEAIGSLAKEYFHAKCEEVPFIRNQFKARYEALVKRDEQFRTMSPQVATAVGLSGAQTLTGIDLRCRGIDGERHVLKLPLKENL